MAFARDVKLDRENTWISGPTTAGVWSSRQADGRSSDGETRRANGGLRPEGSNESSEPSCGSTNGSTTTAKGTGNRSCYNSANLTWDNCSGWHRKTKVVAEVLNRPSDDSSSWHLIELIHLLRRHTWRVLLPCADEH